MLILHDGKKLREYDDMFNCQVGTWPIKYLGIHVGGGGGGGLILWGESDIVKCLFGIHTCVSSVYICICFQNQIC